jgi:transcriptional regulator with XRE-family HTH domain
LPRPQDQFGANLRRLRTAAGLTQMELADRAGINFTAVSRLERGDRDPRLSTVARVARALGVSVAALVQDVGWEEPAPP